jgi:hypothetical protein
MYGVVENGFTALDLYFESDAPQDTSEADMGQSSKSPWGKVSSATLGNHGQFFRLCL